MTMQLPTQDTALLWLSIEKPRVSVIAIAFLAVALLGILGNFRVKTTAVSSVLQVSGTIPFWRGSKSYSITVRSITPRILPGKAG